MKPKVAINGFGRIGRTAFRVALLDYPDELEIVAINTSGSMNIEGWGYLVKYDTAYGRFPKEISWKEIRPAKEATDQNPEIGKIVVEDKEYPVLAQRNPEKLPWDRYKVDVVIESTGVFTDEEGAKKHAKSGAKRVVISAPSKGGNVGTYVLGVNEADGRAVVLSNASCTTNNVAPVVAVIHSKFGIKKAVMTTIHSYTDEQNLQDNSHHKDLRRARAAAQNIVPTTTGAAIATTETIPALKGLFDGRALRVPTITGSITDSTFLVSKKVTIDEVNQAFREASEDPLYQGILAVTEEPLVSSDIIGRTESAIVDLSLTQVVDGDLVKVFAWYDNEWGYVHRLIEQVIRVGKKLHSTEAPADPITDQFRNV